MFALQLRSLIAPLLVCATALPANASFKTDSPTVLITGSNRGIGLAFVDHYAQAGWNVIATARNPDKALELLALAEKFSRLRIEALDVTDHRRIDELADQYRNQSIDLLINNAAILGPLPEQTVGGLDFELFQQVMAVNTYAPLYMSQAFTEHVAASEQKKIVSLASGLASLSGTSRMRGLYYYRMSKAALNMGMRGLRADLSRRGIIVALVAPGLVGTQLLADSGFRGKSITPAESVTKMSKIIAGLSIDDKGEPINVNGKTIPW